MKKYFVSNDTTLPLGGAMIPTKKKKKKKSLPTYIEILIGPPNDVRPPPPISVQFTPSMLEFLFVHNVV